MGLAQDKDVIGKIDLLIITIQLLDIQTRDDIAILPSQVHTYTHTYIHTPTSTERRREMVVICF